MVKSSDPSGGRSLGSNQDIGVPDRSGIVPSAASPRRRGAARIVLAIPRRGETPRAKVPGLRREGTASRPARAAKLQPYPPRSATLRFLAANGRDDGQGWSPADVPQMVQHRLGIDGEDRSETGPMARRRLAKGSQASLLSLREEPRDSQIEKKQPITNPMVLTYNISSRTINQSHRHLER